jgi:hypothetical protein
VNRLEFVKYLRSSSPSISDQEAIKAAFDKSQLLRTPAAAVYPILFGELVDIRARPIISRIFELLKATGKFDPILEHANNALIGIGGSEVIVHAKEALNSSNPRCRETTMRALAGIGEPEVRPIAYSLVAGSDIDSIRGGLRILNGIGPRRDDVGELVRSLQRLESILCNPPNGNRGPNFETSGSDDITAFVFALAGMGAQAEDALPVLEQMATKPRYPLSTTLQEAAQKAVDKIKQDIAKGLP